MDKIWTNFQNIVQKVSLNVGLVLSRTLEKRVNLPTLTLGEEGQGKWCYHKNEYLLLTLKALSNNSICCIKMLNWDMLPV